MLAALIAYFITALIFVAISYAEGLAVPRPSWRLTRVLGIGLAIVWPGVLLVLLTTHFAMQLGPPPNAAMNSATAMTAQNKWHSSDPIFASASQNE